MSEALYHVAAVSFEAARHVDIVPEGHRSRRLHGHSFVARVRAALPDGWAPFPGAETDTLRSVVENCVSRLDYDLLNNHVKDPTDENLARWIRECLDVCRVDVVGVQSAGHQGADLDRDDHVHVWRRFRFEAAHQLPNVAMGHKCGRMHGHGFEVTLHADQDLNGGDMGVDFDHLESLWLPFHEELHLACMNDIAGLENPTSEILSGWIWNRLKPELPELSWVSVYETGTAGCHYDGTHYRIWKEFRFESALQLVRAPQGDRRRRLHGHSYRIRLHLSAPLDRVMGWTIDYGDVKELFSPVYKQLDHHHLNELAGVRDADVASMLHWIKSSVVEVVPQLDRIDLYETPGCGGILCWGEQGPALPL